MLLEGNDKKTIKKRLGHIKRKKEIPFLNFIENECKKRGIELLFDLNDMESKRDALIYTEFFGGMGGVMLRPQNFVRQMKIYTQAHKDPEKRTTDFSKLVAAAGDKYELEAQGETRKKIVLLPGSNMLGTHTDKGLIEAAVNQGAFLKPHPITDKRVLGLINEFWPGKVYNSETSGFYLYSNAQEIWTTRYSEFSLFATLEEKKINFIDDDLVDKRGSYKGLNLFLEINNCRNKKALNNVLNSNKSGIFFKEHNSEADIIEFLDFFEFEILQRGK